MRKLLTTMLGIIMLVNYAKADCEIPAGTSINSSAFLAKYGPGGTSPCTGTEFVIKGKLVMDGNLDLAVAFPNWTKVTIAAGGQIEFSANPSALSLASNTVLKIESTSPTDAGNTSSALYSGNPCNNNKAIYFGSASASGSIKYSACQGGGNVCLLFSALTAQGGSLAITPVITSGGVNVDNNGTVCSSTPSNFSLLFNTTLQNNSGFNDPPSYSWSQQNVSTAPSIATFSPSTTILNPTVTTTAPGTYTFRISVTQNLSRGSCITAATQTVYADFTYTVVQSPTATITGGGSMVQANPSTDSKTVTFSGFDGTAPYTITYSINGVTQTAVSANSTYTITQPNSDPVGIYDYKLLSVTSAGTNCTTNYTDVKTVEIQRPLPVKLTSFNATTQQCKVLLSWKSEFEINGAYYEIQRSINGIQFEKIGTVNMVGPSDYRFQTTALGEKDYYRLKIVDKDGSFEYSEVKAVQSTCSSILVSPTVSNDKINISGLPIGALVKVFGADGRLVMSVKANTTMQIISLSNEAKGMYYLAVFAGNQRLMTQKIIRQ